MLLIIMVSNTAASGFKYCRIRLYHKFEVTDDISWYRGQYSQHAQYYQFWRCDTKNHWVILIPIPSY